MVRLTIVLTLKDRAQFTRRWMAYMNDERCPYPILIADGGADPTIERELRDAARYPRLTYEYIRYPFDTDIAAFYTKQLDVCGRVQTEYVLLADNDDFYLLDELAALVAWMDRSPEHVGVRGQVAHFSVLDAHGAVLNEPRGTSYRAEWHETHALEQEQALDRVTAFLTDLVAYDHWKNWYCVYRTPAFVDALHAVYARRFRDVVMNEILFLITLLRSGKIGVSTGLYYARQAGSSQGETAVLAEHDVLQNLLINDALHDFDVYVRGSGLVETEAGRVRVLKALAQFIGAWCNLFPERYGAARPALRRLLPGRIAGAHRRLAAGARDILLPVAHRLLGTRRRRPIRLAGIEPYIVAAAPAHATQLLP